MLRQLSLIEPHFNSYVVFEAFAVDAGARGCCNGACAVKAAPMKNEFDSDIRPAPEGWRVWRTGESFSQWVGPLYHREEGGPPGVGFFAEARHCNFSGNIHGGMLMTLADMSLFEIGHHAIGFNAIGLTVSLNAEFLAGAPPDCFISATGEVTGGGRKLKFVRGIISAEEKPVVAFSGTIKFLSREVPA